jgi:hypothetical protein
MTNFYLDSNPKLPNHKCELHYVCPETCPNLPAIIERIQLGNLPDLKTAIHIARRKFYNQAHLIKECSHCSNTPLIDQNSDFTSVTISEGRYSA